MFYLNSSFSHQIVFVSRACFGACCWHSSSVYFLKVHKGPDGVMVISLPASNPGEDSKSSALFTLEDSICCGAGRLQLLVKDPGVEMLEALAASWKPVLPSVWQSLDVNSTPVYMVVKTYLTHPVCYPLPSCLSMGSCLGTKASPLSYILPNF